MTIGHCNMNKSIYIQLKCSDVFRRCEELYKNADPYVKALYSLALRSYAYLIDFGFFSCQVISYHFLLFGIPVSNSIPLF